MGQPAFLERSGGIDAFRGALSLWVLLVHTGLWAGAGNATSAQWLGRVTSTVFQPHGETNPAVLAFIVLSGFCIQKSWMNAQELRKFAIRRVFRIGPIFLLGIVAGIAGYLIARSMSSLAEAFSGTSSIEPTCLLAKATAVAALTPAFHPCSYAGNAPLLTVMVEIALYAVFPLLTWCGRKVTFGVCVICLAAGLLISGTNSGWFDWWQNSSLFGFLPYWWIGAAFAMMKQPPSRRWAVWTIAVWIAITIGCEFDRSALLSELRKTPFSLLTGIAIVRLQLHTAPKLPCIVGRAGYSIYALHAPILYTLLIAGVPWYVAASSVILVGLTCFRLIENPIDRLGHSIAKSL